MTPNWSMTPTRTRPVGALGLPILIALLLGLPLVVHNQYFLHVMIVIGINVIMATSMWLLGITGLISFGQAGFMFIGAMTTALLTKRAGWPFWFALPLSAIVPGLVSAPVGRLSLRVKGVYFFLVTLAFGQVVAGVFAYFEVPFGGWYGIRDIPAPQPQALFGALNKTGFYYLILALVLLTCWIIHRISRSWFGMVLWSIREGDLLASSVGVDVPGYKLIAFIVSAFFAGVAGSFYAAYFGYISPLVFTFEYSVNVLVYIVVGGFASLAGPIVGATVLTLVPELFRVTGKYQMMAFGLIMVASMLLMPQGIVGAWQRMTTARVTASRGRT
ncbi:MAG TPA: branched-chain amino acid ABC transporter permease [Rhodopila sp.]|nr:branched-chain amino acid ABC transporter permease [Rhodopila sp.]